MKENEIHKLLIGYLTGSGLQWQSDAGLIRFRLQRDGLIWEIACRCLENSLLVYARYPFSAERSWLLEQCSRVNSQLIRGAFFVPEDGQAVYRIRVEMDDIFGARARLKTALDYQTAVITRFWGDFASCGKSI